MASLHSVNVKVSQLLNYNGQLLCVDVDGRVWSLDKETESVGEDVNVRHVWRRWSFPFMQVETQITTPQSRSIAEEGKLSRNF